MRDEKKVILAVSFGTSYHDSREVTIGAIERAIAEAYPDFEVRRSFTSQVIVNKLKERDHIEIDHIEKALARAAEDGVTTLVVQPTHLMNGYEYMDLVKALEAYKGRFEQFALAKPLLSDEPDFDEVIAAITEATADYDDGVTAVCFMGHGTEAEANSVYGRLQEKVTEAGFQNCFIGTVEAKPDIEDLLAAVKKAGSYRRVVLEPLMVAAGDHANNDMAGDDDASWKRLFEAAGFEVVCIMKGLGQLPAIQKIYVNHTRAAIDTLEKTVYNETIKKNSDRR